MYIIEHLHLIEDGAAAWILIGMSMSKSKAESLLQEFIIDEFNSLWSWHRDNNVEIPQAAWERHLEEYRRNHRIREVPVGEICFPRPEDL